MQKLQDQDILRFCAIPQVMAIATLARVFNNPQVFKGMSSALGYICLSAVFCQARAYF